MMKLSNQLSDYESGWHFFILVQYLYNMTHTVSKACTNQYDRFSDLSELSELTSQDLNRTSTFSEVLDRQRFGYKYDSQIITNLPKSSSFEDNAIILELQDFRLALSKNWIWIPKLLEPKSDYHNTALIKTWHTCMHVCTDIRAMLCSQTFQENKITWQIVTLNIIACSYLFSMIVKHGLTDQCRHTSINQQTLQTNLASRINPHTATSKSSALSSLRSTSTTTTMLMMSTDNTITCMSARLYSPTRRGHSLSDIINTYTDFSLLLHTESAAFTVS